MTSAVSGPGPTVRTAEPRDARAWMALRDLLWPGSSHDHAVEIEAYFADPPGKAVCLVAEAEDGRIAGFAEVGLRDHAEGCRSSPVGYLEGIYVAPDWRRVGVGRALVSAGEAWALRLGCTEMASDRAQSNEESRSFHEALGYAEAGRLVCYRRRLDRVGARPAGAPTSGRPS